MQFKLGPIDLRAYQEVNENAPHRWTNFELAFVTNREGGLARRETGTRLGWRSDHVIEAFGRDNPADTFIDPDSGRTFTGKIISTPTGVYAVTAREVFSDWLVNEARRQGIGSAAEVERQLVFAN